MKKLACFLSCTCFVLIMIACPEPLPDEPEFDNRLIPGDSSFVPPTVEIVSGPAENASVNSHTVTFQFRGNEVAEDFAYRLDDANWSSWTTQTSITLSYLNEGWHLFEVKARNLAGVEHDSLSVGRDFEIDDIRGPALWLYPRRQVVGSGSTFTLTLMAEELTDVMGIYAPVTFNSDYVRLEEYTIMSSSGDFLRKNGGSVLALVDTLDINGSFGFNLAVVEGDPPGVDGTGGLVRLTFRAVGTQNTSIQASDDSRFMNSAFNSTFPSGDQLVPALVEVR
ncbi:MAG TPA: cohesin domain-containing protein [bacterium]|nr:cohesin domain-containing protein [bacterium]